ncbi:hypothetical protein BJX99DRAFT_47436 [Aspergillus californicus]
MHFASCALSRQTAVFSNHSHTSVTSNISKYGSTVEETRELATPCRYGAALGQAHCRNPA